MTVHATRIAVAASLLLGLVAADQRRALGQDVPEVPPGASLAHQRAVMLGRDRFAYPTGWRRDPFLPHSTASLSLRSDEARLVGVIHHPEAARRVAIVGSASTAEAPLPAATASGRPTFRVSIGDTLQSLVVVGINEDHVIARDLAAPDRETVWALPRFQERSPAK